MDIITFDLAQRIPIQLKIPKVREAIQRGLYFEINYSAALTGMRLTSIVTVSLA